jgi:hypothetical protein
MRSALVIPITLLAVLAAPAFGADAPQTTARASSAVEAEAEQRGQALVASRAAMTLLNPRWEEIVTSQDYQRWLRRQSPDVQWLANETSKPDELNSVIAAYQNSRNSVAKATEL